MLAITIKNMTVLELIVAKPVIALLVGACNIIIAIQASDMEVPKIVMQSIQITAWLVAITVGAITIDGNIPKYKAKFAKWKKNRKKNFKC